MSKENEFVVPELTIREPKKIVKQEKPKEVKKEINKQEETRVTKTLTLDRQLVEELIKRSDKARLSLSRYCEITLRKSLRL